MIHANSEDDKNQIEYMVLCSYPNKKHSDVCSDHVGVRLYGRAEEYIFVDTDIVK